MLPLTTHHSRARCLLPYYALLLATCCNLPLTTHRSHRVVRSEDKKLTKDKEKGDADRILRRYALTYYPMPTLVGELGGVHCELLWPCLL